MHFIFRSKRGLKSGNLIHLKEVRPPGFEPVTSSFNFRFFARKEKKMGLEGIELGHWFSRERKRKWGWGESNLATSFRKERDDFKKIRGCGGSNPPPHSL